MENPTLILFFTVLPVLLLLIFVYNSDREKEPFKLLLQMFILGMISSGIVLLFSEGIRIIFPFMGKKLSEHTFLETIMYAFLGVALLEELCKWVMLYFRGYNHQEFDEVYDIIVYAVFVSLGFAFVENAAYVMVRGTLKTALLRAISSVPGHACDAVFMGYFLSLAKQSHYKQNNKLEKKYIVLSILVPALLHGIYDYCLMSKVDYLMYIFVVFIVLLYYKAFTTLRCVSKENKELVLKHNFCKSCGFKVTGDVCPKCGMRQD